MRVASTGSTTLAATRQGEFTQRTYRQQVDLHEVVSGVDASNTIHVSPMRVTGGELGGRRLRVPRRGVRPTSDRVRESTFSILGDVTNFGVLDLYAGSGALGIEALSRGARDAVFVERAPATVEVLRRNLRDLGVRERSRTLRTDASRAVRRLGSEGARFDLILVDPPYEDDVQELLRDLAASGMLAPHGRVVVERRRGHAVDPVDGWTVLDHREYGDTVVTHFGVSPGSGG